LVLIAISLLLYPVNDLRRNTIGVFFRMTVVMPGSMTYDPIGPASSTGAVSSIPHQTIYYSEERIARVKTFYCLLPSE
jgi:hypothetical protein